MFKYELFNSFPSFTKTPIYVDTTNNILLLEYPILPILIHLKNYFIDFTKNFFFITTGIVLSLSNFIYLNLFNIKIISFLFIIVCIYNLNFINELVNKMEALEQKIKHLNKKEIMIENDMERHNQINKKTHEEMENKIKLYEKEMKKMKKEMKMYE